MIIPPDVQSEQDMRWRLALANSVSNIRTGEELAAACTLGVAAIVIVGLVLLWASVKNGAERPIKVYKKRATMNHQEKRIMTGTSIGLLAVTLIGIVVAIVTQHPGTGLVPFAISVLILSIVFEVLADRADGRQNHLKGLLDPDRLVLPKDLSIDDVVLWKDTVENAQAA